MGLRGKLESKTLRGKINKLVELRGYSAYEVAVFNGFEGTEEEWLASLQGAKGDPGTVFLVTVKDNGDGTYVSDKTFAELRAAHNAGETLRCWYYDDDVYLPLTERHGSFTFSAVVNRYIYQVTISSGENYVTKVIFTKTDLTTSGGLTAAQVTAIDELFKIAVFTEDASAKYAAFREAFGLDDSGGDEPGSGDNNHTHSYTSTVTTAATCETAGVRSYTCACGHTYTEAIPATGHNYVDGECTECGAVEPSEPEEPSTAEPVYRLASAITFDGTNQIDTGYKLLDVDKSWSVCVDFENNDTGTIWDASPNGSKGLTLANRGGYYRTFYVAASLYKDISGGSTANHKFIATHVKGTDTVKYYYVVAGQSRVDSEITYTGYLTNANIINENAQTVKLASDFNGTSGLFKGTVNSFEIYERVISADEISAYLGVSA